MDCPNCSGSGTKSTSRGVSYSCKSCSGSGTIGCSKECASCNGTGEISEALQKERREKYQIKFADYSPSNTVTLPLLVVNVIVYLALASNNQLFSYLGLDASTLEKGYYWTFFTASFGHLGIWHLVLNMGFLWTYGQVVEGLLGKQRFLLTYGLCAITAGIVSYLGNVVLDGQEFAGMGASGPLYGLVGVLLALHVRWRMVPPAEVKRLTTWAGGFILLGFALSGTGFDMFDNWGHLGGVLGGFLLTFFAPRPGGKR